MKSNIPTWTERCENHPDHQSGTVTNVMIQRRMQEEIDDLRAANARLLAREALLRAKAAKELKDADGLDLWHKYGEGYDCLREFVIALAEQEKK